MKRWMMIGTVAGVMVGVGATALAFGTHGARETIMQRVVTAAIDDALAEVRATPEQRVAVHAARERVWAIVAEHRAQQTARLEQLLAVFEADQLDAANLQALRRGIETEHARIADAIGQALTDVHGTLSAEQRRQLAEYVRAHRHGAH